MDVPAPLVSDTWLAAHLNDPRVRVVDMRWYLAGKCGAHEYALGHIPGAMFVDLEHDLAAPGHGPGRHPLPQPQDFARVLRRLGVAHDSIVVAYDDAGGAIAARLWWMLRWVGHGGGRVLDGGLTTWLASSRPLVVEVPKVEPTPLLDLVDGGGIVDKREVDRLRHDPAAVILDARSPERYEGRVEPIDARPGHIPGALSAPYSKNLAAPSARMKPPADLAAHYRQLGALNASTVVCYCGSGVTACHDVLALTLAGRDDALIYEGSWSDWASDRELPAALGPAST